MKLNQIRSAFLDAIRCVDDIIPLYHSGMLSKDEAVSTLKRLYTGQEYYALIRFINHDLIAPRNEWMRETALNWAKKNLESVESIIKHGIFTVEELKPLIFMHLTRMFNEENIKSNRYASSGERLILLEKMGYLTPREVDTFLTSMHLLKSDVKAYYTPEELSMS